MPEELNIFTRVETFEYIAIKAILDTGKKIKTIRPFVLSGNVDIPAVVDLWYIVKNLILSAAETDIDDIWFTYNSLEGIGMTVYREKTTYDGVSLYESTILDLENMLIDSLVSIPITGNYQFSGYIVEVE